MRVTNFPACCAAYMLSNLDYISPYNSWFQANKEQFELPEDTSPVRNRDHGFMTMTMADSAYDVVVVRRGQLIDKLKSGESKIEDISYHFQAYQDTSRVYRQYYLNSRVSQHTEVKSEIVPSRDSKNIIKKSQTIINPQYVDALSTELLDTLAFFVRYDYMIYAITNSRFQAVVETVLPTVGLEKIASVLSRNNTILNTWYANYADNKKFSEKWKKEVFGSNRMEVSWQSGLEKAKSDHLQMKQDWDTALYYNENPEERETWLESEDWDDDDEPYYDDAFGDDFDDDF